MLVEVPSRRSFAVVALALVINTAAAQAVQQVDRHAGPRKHRRGLQANDVTHAAGAAVFALP